MSLPPSILLSIGKFIWWLSTDNDDVDPAVEARSLAEAHLMKQYDIPEFESNSLVSSGGTYGAGSTVVTKRNWEPWVERTAIGLRQVLGFETVSDETREACGELALFLLVVRNGAIPGVEELAKSETWRSLFAMGRGRGGSFALRLIQHELVSFVEEAGVKVGD